MFDRHVKVERVSLHVHKKRMNTAASAFLNAESRYAQLHPDFSKKEFDDLPAWDALDR